MQSLKYKTAYNLKTQTFCKVSEHIKDIKDAIPLLIIAKTIGIFIFGGFIFLNIIIMPFGADLVGGEPLLREYIISFIPSYIFLRIYTVKNDISVLFNLPFETDSIEEKEKLGVILKHEYIVSRLKAILAVINAIVFILLQAIIFGGLDIKGAFYYEMFFKILTGTVNIPLLVYFLTDRPFFKHRIIKKLYFEMQC